MLKQVIELARVVIMGVALLTSVGCASFFNTPVTSVTIDSNPQNAQFVIADHKGEVIHSGTTPEDVVLHNSKAMYQRARYTVRYELAGLPARTTELNATLSPYYFGNILLGFPGFAGFVIIDPFTGAIYNLPDVHSVDLNALDTNALNTGASTLGHTSDAVTMANRRNPGGSKQ